MYFFSKINYPDLNKNLGYGIICIWYWEKLYHRYYRDIGYCGCITSNYDGSIISFGSSFDFDHKNKKILKKKERLEKVLTYKLNPSTSKYEQFVDPIIEERSQDYWKKPWDIFMSKDNQKLIVNYDLFQFDSTIHIYDDDNNGN